MTSLNSNWIKHVSTRHTWITRRKQSIQNQRLASKTLTQAPTNSQLFTSPFLDVWHHTCPVCTSQGISSCCSACEKISRHNAHNEHTSLCSILVVLPLWSHAAAELGVERTDYITKQKRNSRKWSTVCCDTISTSNECLRWHICFKKKTELNSRPSHPILVL